jgi:hypothetical protein
MADVAGHVDFEHVVAVSMTITYDVSVRQRNHTASKPSRSSTGKMASAIPVPTTSMAPPTPTSSFLVIAVLSVLLLLLLSLQKLSSVLPADLAHGGFVLDLYWLRVCLWRSTCSFAGRLGPGLRTEVCLRCLILGIALGRVPHKHESGIE